MLRSIALFALVVSGTEIRAQVAPQNSVRWHRGNTHVHTTESDGNGSPADVTRWYREHGYSFVVITDHERITDVGPLQAEFGVTGKFLVMQGQEVTQQIADSARVGGNRQAHVVAIGLNRVVPPLGVRGITADFTLAQTYARNIAEVRAANGLPQVNHPNFKWSVKPDDMMSLPDSTLFEVWNAEPKINNLGGDDGAGNVSLSTSALWDTLLTRGKLLYGVASDDAHKFKQAELEDFETTRPGGGWVMVRADTLTSASIMSAMRAGHFYSTTGVLLSDYAVDAKTVSLRIAFPDNARDDRRFHTRFVGRGGRVLADIAGPTPSYTIRGDEGYIRAEVFDSNGRRAWTQPFWVGKH